MVLSRPTMTEYIDGCAETIASRMGFRHCVEKEFFQR
jgi:hypothetical protein